MPERSRSWTRRVVDDAWDRLDLRSPATELALRHLWLDTLGCAAAGAARAELGAIVAAQAAFNPGPIALPGPPGPGLGLNAAALAGSAAACWDEACEGLASAHGRPGVPVVMALQALAQVRPIPLSALMRATLLGYEVGARAGAALRIRAGMHVDGHWPALGVAAAIACALGMDRDETVRAIEYCACRLGASLYLPIVQGSTWRNLYLGQAACAGIDAALAARAGLGEVDGAVEAHVAAIALASPADDAPPEGWRIDEAYWKPWPCVRHAHYPVGALEDLAAPPPPADAVLGVEIVTYDEAIRYAGNRAPTSAIAAQFSLSYAVAAWLRFGELTPAAFSTAALADPSLRRLEARVTLVPDPRRYPAGRRGAGVTLRLADRRIEARCDAALGDPQRPPSAARRLAKFTAYTEAWAQRGRIAARLLDTPGDDDSPLFPQAS